MIDVSKRIELFSQGYWEIPEDLDTTGFDFSWRPDPYDRPYIHQFGTQWQKNGGPRFVIPENEGVKYQSHQRAIKIANSDNRCWRPLRANIEMDYSWHPDEDEPPFIYVFGNQWYNSVTMPTVQYRVKGATEKKYINNIKAKLLPTMDNWINTEFIDDSFDYSWVPSPHEPAFIWEFGTQHQRNGGPCYVVPGANFKKRTGIMTATKLPDPDNRAWRPLVTNATIDMSWHPDADDPDYIYVFGNQWYDALTMPTFQYRVKGATEKKYVEFTTAKLLEDKERWTIPDDITDEFDYSWKPSPYEPPLIYQFGTQWQKTGGPIYTVEGATTVKFIDTQKATKIANMRNWRIPEEIEDGFDFTWHPDDTEPPMMYEFATQHQKSGGPIFVVKGATSTKYTDAQIAIRKENVRKWRIIEPINKETFDFTWHPDESEGAFNYIFGNKFHTTEVMPTVMYRSSGAQSNKYLETHKADLLVSETKFEDSIFDAMWRHTFDTRYVHFRNGPHPINYSMFLPSYDENLYIHVIDNVEAIIPSGIKNHFNQSITDYPFVKHHSLGTHVEPLDIIFISNGDECAEDNYNHLLSLNLPNRIVRIQDVNGRVASQHAAANASNTPWYFLINAKLKVNKDFDFNWQPDILKSRRHYIFRAKNPINGLEYGHMAMVANNKKLTLETVVRGLDFTMDSPHEIVNQLSGTAVFNSAWDVWRTAFRECIKLCKATDKESNTRLIIWANMQEGVYGQDSINGARDAIAYYTTVNGDMTELMKTYDWAWLRSYYNSLNP